MQMEEDLLIGTAVVTVMEGRHFVMMVVAGNKCFKYFKQMI